MKNRKLVLILVILVLFLFHFSTIAFAAPSFSDIGVKPILPENQKEGVAGYYDLEVKPGFQQEVYLSVQNNKDEPIIVQLIPANAYSTLTGGIVYQASLDSDDAKLLDNAFALSQYLSLNNELALQPYEVREVPIKISVPNIKSGTLLGGIVVQEIKKENQPDTQPSEEQKDKATFNIKTQVAYAIAIQLDLPEPAETNFSFGNAGFDPDSGNVYIDMKNEAARIEKDISGVYSVANEQGKLLFDGDLKPFIITPKTQMRYYMPWDYDTLETGTYTLFIKANVNGQDVTAQQTFKIATQDVAKYVEKHEVTTIKTGISPIYWGISGIIIIALLIVVFLLVKKNKKQSDSKQKG